jgi:hypothetical protein
VWLILEMSAAEPGTSFAAEGDHRVDARGATRRQKTGQSGDEAEQAGYRKVDRRIERIDFEKDVF